METTFFRENWARMKTNVNRPKNLSHKVETPTVPIKVAHGVIQTGNFLLDVTKKSDATFRIPLQLYLRTSLEK